MAPVVDDQMRWVRRGGLVAALVAGWLFIFFQNEKHITAPVVFVALAYLAVIAMIYNLWRTGAAVAAADDGASWSAPVGARGDLEKEKRTLLKAIKEAEFDHAMGKLSKADADAMIEMYRTRAIAVMKELERPEDDQGQGSVREQIEREVKARVELGKKPKKKEAAS